MRILGSLIAFFLTLAAPKAWAQTWPDLADDAGVQGGGENDAALIVGVTDYYNLPKIDGAAQNAEAWQQWLLRSRKVPSTRVELLTDKLATREKIEKNLEQLAQQVGPRGTLWFIFIGHGAPNKEGTDGLLLGVDTDADSDSLSARGVAQERALSLIGQGKQAHSVVVFDACFSGKTGDGGTTLVKGMMATLPNRKAASAPIKATVLAASDSFAGPLPNADRPAYSYLLLGALRGWADENGDKDVDVDEAHEFTRSHIQRLFKGSDRLPSKRGPSVVLAKNVREKQPDMAALVSGKCPSGWTWGGRECKQVVVECPAGTTWNGTACVSLCPAGTSWNGRACAATTIECPTGTEWNGSACVGKQLASLPAPPAQAGDGTRAGETRRDGRGITWVWMPSGSFHYGCEPQDTQCFSDEKPGQRREVDGFWMLQTEVTVGAWARCADAGGCPTAPREQDWAETKTCNWKNGRSEHPMNCVNWEEAASFCRWVGGRLPSAVEWEYAAKSGSSRIYPWGDDGVTGRRANFCDANCPSALSAASKETYPKNGWITFGEDDGWAGTAPVGSFPWGDTPWGLKDMAGNVWEWTSSAYDSSNKEMRGGAWEDIPRNLRAGYRARRGPGGRYDSDGFRCAQ